jgi:hypothetical protein
LAKKLSAQSRENDKKVYTFDVFIIAGPMTRSFMKENKIVSRTIQIRSDQTLEELHHAIFDAFDREEDHMYEFQIGGKGPMDPKARRYVLKTYDDGLGAESKPSGDVRQTTIGLTGLKENEAFGYWFDFGDNWWHQIDVVSVEELKVSGKYPKVTKRVGKSPPQYVDWDEEDG